jgi:hypothetical protein
MGVLPLFSTARHSSSVFSTGYDILLESLASEVKRPPIIGMGIDLSELARRGDEFRSDVGCEARDRVKFESVYRVRSTLEKWKRMERCKADWGFQRSVGGEMVVYIVQELHTCGSWERRMRDEDAALDLQII